MGHVRCDEEPTRMLDVGVSTERLQTFDLSAECQLDVMDFHSRIDLILRAISSEPSLDMATSIKFMDMQTLDQHSTALASFHLFPHLPVH